MSKLALSFAVGLLGLCACSGKVASGPSTSPGDAGADAPSNDDCTDCEQDSGPAPDAGPTGPCPAGAPSPGAACAREGLECEYGTSQYPACDLVVQCSGGAWQAESFGGDCPSGANPPGCPATMGDVPVDAACDPNIGTCHYALGQCYCGAVFGPPEPPPGTDGGGPTATWSCDDPGPDCPQPRPRLGAACTQEGQSCMYFTCDFGEQCTGGIWQGEPAGCAGAAGGGAGEARR